MNKALASYYGFPVVEVPDELVKGQWALLPVHPWAVVPLSRFPDRERRLYMAAGGEITMPTVVCHSIEDLKHELTLLGQARG